MWRKSDPGHSPMLPIPSSEPGMIITEDITALRECVQVWRQQGQVIGFVPTMGHLHEGHLSLVQKARLSCDRLVVSIYVNPLQFNQSSDFEAYPRTLTEDQQLLEQAQVDALFLPDTDLMYPQGQAQVTKVSVPFVTEELEGAHRPGHFDGVATIVLKLFNLVQPDLAVFGEKDYQQLLLVRKMVTDLNLDIEIQSGETRREADGLAMSSRNSRLGTAARAQAAQLYAALRQAREKALAGQSLVEIESETTAVLAQQGFEVEYIAFRDATDLSQPQPGARRRLLAAAWLDGVRLIDNLPVD